MAAEAANGGAGGKGKKGKGGKGGKGGGEGGGEGADPNGTGQDITEQMTTQQLISTGRKTMSETEKSIQRSARVVEDTIAIGQQTAAMLGEQTHQMEKVVNDLDEIHFSMKKAKKLIGDITRSMATDKCILMILMLIVGGIVVVVILKVAKVKLVKGINISVPLPTSSPPPMPPPPTPVTTPAAGRKMLLEQHVSRRAAGSRSWEDAVEAAVAWLGAQLHEAHWH
jgi:Snare region anchored in the vesicle membrane C-terminus